MKKRIDILTQNLQVNHSKKNVSSFESAPIVTAPILVSANNAPLLTGSTKELRLVIKNEHQSTATKEHFTTAGHIISLILTYAFLVFFALLFIFPFYWMIITSLKSGDEIKGFSTGGVQTFWPVNLVNNYANLNETFAFGTYVTNTLIVGIFSTIGTIITCILAAFAFSRLEFKGKDFMFTLLLSTMMIPGEMMVVTNYVSVSNLGWTDGSATGAYLAMIIPFMVSVFYIYLLRQNFMQIPNELYLAAKVDGKSDWQYLWKVMVPLAMPSLITIFILKLMGAWNSYIWPNLITSGNRSLWLVSNGLRSSFSTGTNFDAYGQQMAATVLVTLPLLLIFIVFRKYIMRGVSRAGIKG
ncbi:MAG: carbohydrate ABC transporter permease [Bacilli bacterium]|jgi:multiple sugar transport system permease protein